MITFELQDVTPLAFDREAAKDWIKAVAARYDRRVGQISYRFCDDEAILDANQRFLGHDYYTDVITFDDSEGDTISGDVIISLDTVASNARQQGCPPREEFFRVMIHGVLHLCGLNDKGPGERELMEQAENEALSLRPASLR